MAEVVGLFADRLPPLHQVALLLDQSAEARVALRHEPGLGGSPGKAVEQLALGVGLEQGDRLVLAVQIGEGAAELFQGRHRGRAAIDPGPRSPLGRHFPADHDPVVLGIEAERFEDGLEPARQRLEDALDDRLLRAGPDRPAFSPASEQQGQSIDQHRLAGAGFAGQDVEAGAQMEGRVGDCHQVTNPELGDHWMLSRSARSPQRRLCRIRAK